MSAVATPTAGDFDDVRRLFLRAVAARRHSQAFALNSAVYLSFGEWGDRSELVAAALRSRGFRENSIVGIVVSEDAWFDYCAAFFGVLLAGFTPLTISSKQSATIIDNLISGLEMACVITGVTENGQPLVSHYRHVARKPESGGPSDWASALLTSGTTGLPKVVLMSHENLLRTIGSGSPSNELARVLYAPVVGTHLAQVALLRPLASDQAVVHIESTFSAGSVSAAIDNHALTEVTLNPVQARRLSSYVRARKNTHPTLRRIAVTGDSSSPQLLSSLAEKFPTAEIKNFYTTTEAYPAAISTTYDAARPLRIGIPDDQRVEVRIETAPPATAGATGRIWLRAVGVDARTVLEPPGWRPKRITGGWVDTGDVGYLDGDGALHLIDRDSDVINVGGIRTGTRLSENRLLELDAVHDAAVVAIDSPSGKYLAAVIVPSVEVTAAYFREVLANDIDLPRHAVPRRFYLVEFIPRNAAGKVDKNLLRQQFDEHDSHGTSEHRDKNFTETTQWLQTAWEEVLDFSGPILLGDDFLRLGGDSLAVEELTEIIATRTGLRLEFEDLAACESFSSMVSLIIDQLGSPQRG